MSRLLPQEGQDLDRHHARAQPLDQLALIGDDHKAVRGDGDELLAHQRAAAALEEVELGVDLVGPVHGQVKRLLQGVDQRDAQRCCLLVGVDRARYARHAQTRPHPLAEQVDEERGRGPRAEPEPHPVLHQLDRRLRSGPLQRELLMISQARRAAPALRRPRRGGA